LATLNNNVYILIHNHYNNFIDWDVPNWVRALMYLDSKKSVSFKDKKVLEIGARDGYLSLWAAIKGAHVICSDINGPSEVANKAARPL